MTLEPQAPVYKEAKSTSILKHGDTISTSISLIILYHIHIDNIFHLDD